MSHHEEKLKEQLNFFDYIYPHISRRLDECTKQAENNHRLLLDALMSINLQNEIIDQYKKKIQRIEQFLIQRGLIELLGK